MPSYSFNPRLPGGRRRSPRLSPAGQGIVSIHAFRGEGDTGTDKRCRAHSRFNPRLPGGRRPPPLPRIAPAFPVSIHAFRGEGDPSNYATALRDYRFNPRLPGGRRPRNQPHSCNQPGVSIHAFRGEGDQHPCYRDARAVVSIHAFRGEGDRRQPPHPPQLWGFNPRLPGGRRPKCAERCARRLRFQSTPSGGKATRAGSPTAARTRSVSIHAFRGEGDPDHARRSNGVDGRFNPRLPGGRRPICWRRRCRTGLVSIHAFRGEGDRSAVHVLAEATWFQSTPSGGKATGGYCAAAIRDDRFNPRLPGGRRPLYGVVTLLNKQFQSTPSGGKATEEAAVDGFEQALFQSTPSGGKATRCGARGVTTLCMFQSTPSGGKATAH